MKLGITLIALCACLVLPVSAQADSGSITVTSNSYAGTLGYAEVGVSVTVTKTTCDWGSTYCGWFPSVTEVESTQACTTDSPRYTGQIVEGLGTYSQDLATATLAGTSTKLCLYVYSNGDRFLTETVVQLNSSPSPTPPPPPAPTPSPGPSPGSSQPAPTRPLSIADARANLRGILRDEYGSRFTRRSRYHRSCYRYTTQKVRCRVRWDYKRRYRYSGSVTIRNDPEDPVGSIVYTTSIRRKRLQQPRRPAQPPRRAPSRPTPSCDANYGGCLDPNAYDYDCAGGSGDGPRYTGPVRVVGNDHYGLDRDGDGIGCDE